MEEFPLLTEALKFYNHDDHMVRVAVRTLTLNIYGIEDVGMREYIANRTAGEVESLATLRPASAADLPPQSRSSLTSSGR